MLTRVHEVEDVNDPNELGDVAVRYDQLRCPDCGRMYWCIRWEDYGHPEVECPPCGIRRSWPFEDEPRLKKIYDDLSRYYG